MAILRILAAYLAAVVVTFTAASAFNTQQVLAKRMAINVYYTPAQQWDTYVSDFLGLAPSYGMVLAIGLAVAFVIAAGAKRVLKPLAPVAYPLAGAAAVFTALYSIENFVAGGAGAFSGALSPAGMTLQCFAGAFGGLVFALLKGRGNR